MKDQIDAYELRRRIQLITNAFVNFNFIEKPNKCAHCKKEKHLVAHHEDYMQPLYIQWLCESCHSIEHHRLNKEKRDPFTLFSKHFQSSGNPLLPSLQKYLFHFCLSYSRENGLSLSQDESPIFDRFLLGECNAQELFYD